MSEHRLKQIIVMRKDLSMRKGKMIAQGAHASMAAVVPYLTTPPPVSATLREIAAYRDRQDTLTAWLSNAFTKVCVSVDSEQELLDVYAAAQDAGLISALITDSGLTEFNGVPTKTCCAIGPASEEALAPITGEARPDGRLKLL